jgi:hypothetical protein
MHRKMLLVTFLMITNFFIQISLVICIYNVFSVMGQAPSPNFWALVAPLYKAHILVYGIDLRML